MFHRHGLFGVAVLLATALLACGDDAANSSCGDGVIEAAELCDGTDLGERTCVDEGFGGGDINIHTFSTDASGMVASFGDIRAFMDDNGGDSLPLIVTAAQIGDANQCPYGGMTLEQEGQIMSDFYTCLANAGAAEVYMYKSTDRDPSLWGDNRCLPEVERSGVLGIQQEGYPRQPGFFRLRAIGEYLNDICPPDP